MCAHNRVQENAGDVYLQLKVLSMGRQKAVIKARREAKRVLRRDSRSHKQREEESVTSLVQMGGVEAIGMARDSRDTSPVKAQNVTAAQMKMFLTRLGENVTVIVNGDITQCDLPRGVRSGLSDALERFEEDEMVGIVHFNKDDCVRSALCQRTLHAYS
ncbi:hypothetical protein HES90_000465 [Salmonella enterica]|nr:hypothetical protein [Salmonella enterica]